MMQPQEVHLFRVAVNYHQYAVYVSSLPFQNMATPSNEIMAVIFPTVLQNREQLHNPFYVREFKQVLRIYLVLRPKNPTLLHIVIFCRLAKYISTQLREWSLHKDTLCPWI